MATCVLCGDLERRPIGQALSFCGKDCELHFQLLSLIGPQVKRKGGGGGGQQQNAYEPEQPPAPKKVVVIDLTTPPAPAPTPGPVFNDGVGTGGLFSGLPPGLAPAPHQFNQPPQPAWINVNKGYNADRTALRTIWVSNQCLLSRGIRLEPTNYLASGSHGSVYFACATPNNCNAIVKIGNVDQVETYIQNEAGVLGFGPQLMLPPFSCGTTDPVQSVVGFVVMERLTITLWDVLVQRTCTQEDVVQICDLIRRFAAANFIHHDIKPDNIMCRESLDPVTRVRTRRWYIIDFGYAWYGGRHYGNPAFAPPLNTPYGWDLNNNRQRLACQVYGGWSQDVPEVPSRDWDIAQLAYFVSVYRIDGNFQSEAADAFLQQIRVYHPNVHTNVISSGGRILWSVLLPNGTRKTFPHRDTLLNSRPPCTPEPVSAFPPAAAITRQ